MDFKGLQIVRAGVRHSSEDEVNSGHCHTLLTQPLQSESRFLGAIISDKTTNECGCEESRCGDVPRVSVCVCEK